MGDTHSGEGECMEELLHMLVVMTAHFSSHHPSRSPKQSGRENSKSEGNVFILLEEQVEVPRNCDSILRNREVSKSLGAAYSHLSLQAVVEAEEEAGNWSAMVSLLWEVGSRTCGLHGLSN